MPLELYATSEGTDVVLSEKNNGAIYGALRAKKQLHPDHEMKIGKGGNTINVHVQGNPELDRVLRDLSYIFIRVRSDLQIRLSSAYRQELVLPTNSHPREKQVFPLDKEATEDNILRWLDEASHRTSKKRVSDNGDESEVGDEEKSA